MNRTEHLLTVLAEECAEMSKEVSKALRFGLDNCMPEPPLNGAISNRQRIADELADLLGMVDWLCLEGIIPAPPYDKQLAKRERVERYMAYARSAGTLEAER